MIATILCWYYVMVLSSSVLCRQNDFHVISSSLRILLNFEHNDAWHWIKVGIDLEYCISTCFQTRVCVSKQESLMYKNGCFCYMYTESLFFILFDGFSLINFLGKSISMISSEKMQSYDVTITVFDIKGGNFKFWIFLFFIQF